MTFSRKKKIIGGLLLLFMAFSLMPDFFAVADVTLKPMYLIFVFLMLCTINEKMRLPNNPITYLFVFALVQSILMIPSWGISRTFFNYCFGFVILVIFLTFGDYFCQEEWEKTFQNVWKIVFIAIIINNLQQAFRFVEYVEYALDHPYIKTVISGGVNIEATWIAILALSFFRNKKRWLPLGISFALSTIYQSRSGTIANILVAMIFIFGSMPKDVRRGVLRKIFNRRVIACVLAVIVIVFILFFNSDTALKALARFKDIGKDSGSEGRLAMWRYVLPTIGKYPFGVGLGNVIPAIETVSPLKYTEDNIHNLFMQMFIELGIFGGVIYISFWISFIRKEFHNILNSPLIAMLFAYCLLCLVQFSGGETIFFCILGIYFSQKSRYKKLKNVSEL